MQKKKKRKVKQATAGMHRKLDTDDEREEQTKKKMAQFDEIANSIKFGKPPVCAFRAAAAAAATLGKRPNKKRATK